MLGFFSTKVVVFQCVHQHSMSLKTTVVKRVQAPARPARTKVPVPLASQEITFLAGTVFQLAHQEHFQM